MKDTMLVVRLETKMKEELSKLAKKKKTTVTRIVEIAIFEYMCKEETRDAKTGATCKTR